MKKNYFSFLWLVLSVLFPSGLLQAQTNDINFIVSPTLGYTSWSKHANLGATAYWGARVGWSFGQNVEVYGTYDRTFDLKGKLREGNWNVLNTIADRMEGSTARMDRWGGEVKVNFLPNTLFTPYALGGAGAMTIRHDALEIGESDYREEQLFGVLGLGAKFNLTHRLTLGLEVRNTLFNLDESSHYRNSLSSTDKTLHNWSLSASFNLYLGGTSRSKNPLEEALRAKYSGGLKGWVYVADPSVAYINFSHNSRLQDQWFWGTAAGVDFTPVLGARAFYYASTENPSQLSLKIDGKVQLYGADFIGRLNYLRGLTPYLSLGGGYMNVKNSYVDRYGEHNAESGWFALAGAGLEMPIHRHASIFGAVNAMLCENENPEFSKAYRPSQVRANMMYRMGVRLRIGKGAQNASKLYDDYAMSEVARLRNIDMQEQAVREDAERQKKLRLMSFYDERIAQLDSLILYSAQEEDTLLIRRLEEERELLSDSKEKMLNILDPDARKKMEAEADSLKNAKLMRETSGAGKKRNTVVLTAAQLNEIIDSVVAGRPTHANAAASAPVTLSDLDKILLFALVNNGHSLVPSGANALGASGRVAGSVEVLGVSAEEIEALRKRIEQLEKELSKSKLKPTGK